MIYVLRFTFHVSRFTFYALLMLCFSCLNVHGSPSVPTGARQLGMGETFTGVADDANAIFYNPAGLSRIERYGFTFMRAQLYDLGAPLFGDVEEGQSSISVVIPPSKNFALGFGYEQLGIVDDAIDFSQQRFTVPISFTNGIFSVGVNLKTFQMKTRFDGFEIGNTSTKRAGIDAGILIRPTFLPTSLKNRLQLGAMVSDLYGGTVTHKTGAQEDLFPIHLRVGLMYDLIRNEQQTWHIACDMDNDRIHVGSEYSPHPLFVVRGGIQKELRTSEPLTYSIGATAKYEGDEFEVFVDGAYVHHPTLPGSTYISLSLSLPRRAPIKIEAVQFREIYPALTAYYNRFNPEPQIVVILHEKTFELMESAVIKGYDGMVQFQSGAQKEWKAVSLNMNLETKSRIQLGDLDSTLQIKGGRSTIRYRNSEEEKELKAEDKIGRIWLENRTEVPIEVQVFIEVPEIAKEQSVTETVWLPPKAKASLPLPQISFVDQSILSRTSEKGSNPAQLRIKPITDRRNELYESKTIRSFTTTSRNDIVWDDVRKIGAFINPKDESVKAFSDAILSHFRRQREETEINPNFYNAMLIFHALRVYGTYFNPDSNHPYRGRDEIKYPAERLSAGVTGIKESLGDCDDGVTLFCACLEAIDIPTAVIELPGHVLMAFDSGITEDAEEAIPIDILEKCRWFERQKPDSEPAPQTLWIPVETTLIQSGFYQAWEAAAKRLETAPFKYVVLQGDAWEIYPPVNLPPDGTQNQMVDKLKKVIEGLPDETFKSDLAEETIRKLTFQPPQP